MMNTKITVLYLFCQKWYPFIDRPLTNSSHLDILPTRQCLKYFLTTPLCRPYGIPQNPMIDTENTNLPLLCRKWYEFIAWPWTNGSHLGFFTHNAMSKISSDNTIMYGIHENHKIDTKTQNCLYYVENNMILLLDLEQMAAILKVLPTMHCLKYFLTYHYVRHTWKPHNRHQKHESVSIL